MHEHFLHSVYSSELTLVYDFIHSSWNLIHRPETLVKILFFLFSLSFSWLQLRQIYHKHFSENSGTNINSTFSHNYQGYATVIALLAANCDCRGPRSMCVFVRCRWWLGTSGVTINTRSSIRRSFALIRSLKRTHKIVA